MNPDGKKLLVKKLVGLTVRDPLAQMEDDATELSRIHNEAFRKELYSQQIEVRMKHFSIEQLTALLNFYETEMGKSILKSQKLVEEEFLIAVEVASTKVVTEMVGRLETGEISPE